MAVNLPRLPASLEKITSVEVLSDAVVAEQTLEFRHFCNLNSEMFSWEGLNIEASLFENCRFANCHLEKAALRVL